MPGVPKGWAERVRKSQEAKPEKKAKKQTASKPKTEK